MPEVNKLFMEEYYYVYDRQHQYGFFERSAKSVQNTRCAEHVPAKTFFGLQINGPKDGAAGLAISTRFGAQIRALISR